MSPRHIRKYCVLNPGSRKLLNHALTRLKLSARAHDRILKMSRTLADMASFTFIRQFANHDRKWFDAQPIPHLQRWLQGHLESDIFKAVMPKFKPWKAGEEPILFGPGEAAN